VIPRAETLRASKPRDINAGRRGGRGTGGGEEGKSERRDYGATGDRGRKSAANGVGAGGDPARRIIYFTKYARQTQARASGAPGYIRGCISIKVGAEQRVNIPSHKEAKGETRGERRIGGGERTGDEERAGQWEGLAPFSARRREAGAWGRRAAD